ncbi:N-acetylglucosamine-6-phosphate deacetylase [Latilactobacillus curvatus]|uniref:N-acetylglucosamine-6-phosphate deacetylase n=1 Tax=Latilactobacillus curvatus TaxID=28038 RepID=UPI0011DCCE6F|nr:N-acetylglucosamine-6-phosphate deacetylase [Latilactobacillus curvatus]MCM6843194.1 N-acetylglucosamine-6-phosphate deacetylase [Latilactobacillus curvatus]MCM6861923.1 N-acetylglucosamine-6-phosphate deacetylase [Latilactobacillus curvatus]MCM6869221.1 N-acetylglucosamine-6-phosphate deacetylase [Latilactobacillus curvatus]MDG2983013.1 N-acetylglucosamine-6-phosphate deacetylase [Latilactobacillus curvatus]UTB71821.1 N-acetylglucosamine-6-phosphate deacetylase [Latilactobacillus curvatus]
MATYYIHADKFFLKNSVENGGYLAIVDGHFGAYQTDKPNGDVKDYTGKWIAPGLVDTHIHGLKGHDVMDNDFDGVKAMSEGLLECGVTSFLPTTLTAAPETLNEVIADIGDRHAEVTGAKIQGVFFEGPFFTEEHKGAQNPKYFSDPSLEIFNHWQELAHGIIKKIAIAPERKGAKEFTAALKQQGVKVALAHSSATYEEAKEVVEAGASIFVHTYNGMSPLNHREPGMVGAAMTLKDVFAELICDGHHVHPQAAQALISVRGTNQTALITDCMRAGAMPEGPSMLGEFPVMVKDGAARLESGSLAGSVLMLKQAVKHVVDWNIATPAQAIKMASQVPAESVGIDDQCGSITPNHAADFIVFDHDLNLVETYLDGISRYQK